MKADNISKEKNIWECSFSEQDKWCLNQSSQRDVVLDFMEGYEFCYVSAENEFQALAEFLKLVFPGGEESTVLAVFPKSDLPVTISEL